MLNVACVLRSGGVYDYEWVQRLRGGVERHLSIPHRFVVLTDIWEGPVGVEYIPLRHNWKGWWSKIELFRPGLFDGPVLYFDLDTIITGNLDSIGNYPHRFTMAHEFYRPKMYCSTAMAWDSHQDFGLYADFCDNAGAIMRAYDQRRSDRKIGDQGFIETHMDAIGLTPDTFRDLFGERTIASYKVHKCHEAPPHDAVAVAFHGKPKPHEIEGNWVEKIWRQGYDEIDAMALSRKAG